MIDRITALREADAFQGEELPSQESAGTSALAAEPRHQHTTSALSSVANKRYYLATTDSEGKGLTVRELTNLNDPELYTAITGAIAGDPPVATSTLPGPDASSTPTNGSAHAFVFPRLPTALHNESFTSTEASINIAPITTRLAGTLNTSTASDLPTLNNIASAQQRPPVANESTLPSITEHPTAPRLPSSHSQPKSTKSTKESGTRKRAKRSLIPSLTEVRLTRSQAKKNRPADQGTTGPREDHSLEQTTSAPPTQQVNAEADLNGAQQLMQIAEELLADAAQLPEPPSSRSENSSDDSDHNDPDYNGDPNDPNEPNDGDNSDDSDEQFEHNEVPAREPFRPPKRFRNTPHSKRPPQQRISGFNTNFNYPRLYSNPGNVPHGKLI